MHPARPSGCALGLMLALLPAAGSFADAVRLKSAVRLPAGASEVRLAEVADVEGPEAARFADLVVADFMAGAEKIEIPIARVRMLLSDAGAHWGLLNLSGSRVVVLAARPGAAAPVAMRGATLAARARRADARRPAEDRHVAAELLARDTLRGVIAREMVGALCVEPGDLRLVFAAEDQPRLDQAVGALAIELRPDDSFLSDRITFTIRAWSDGRVMDKGRISVRPLLRVPLAVLRRDVDRNETICEADLEVTADWLPPAQAQLACPPAEAVDRVATRSLETGAVLRRRQVRPPTVIERGDRVQVRCLVGGVVISLQAEARADGAHGDQVELRKLGEKETFMGTVVGPGEAVLDLEATR